MQQRVIISGLFGVLFLCGVCQAGTGKELKDEQSRINYSIGYQIGGDFKRQGLKLDSELLVQGLRDAMEKNSPLLSLEQMNTTLIDLKKKLTSDQAKNSKQNDAAFLAENAAIKGVVVLPSGVQYNIIKEGSGASPALKDSVTIKYKASRVDGKGNATEYPDSPPQTYKMESALPGLQEVLKLMKTGSIWRVVIPPGRAMGNKGEFVENTGVLVYTMELVSIINGK